ncbi:hypothetical protein OOT33_08160 [Sphingobium sp. DEHP117]|uniref:DUF4139 domain-containing protein n=1 Tax=Sphingobium sp. DEHP117 TaxID=2993436 RepID=UPI0027D63951|nr:hypothetical protein [Sphingobium sp. DEHP117]MDQ4420401.1 hypothetical protein [Sphingobium sp. DEHP117]
MRAALASLLALTSAPALAQSVVVSSAPVSSSVTVYRDMGRGDGAMNLGWLNGYALISEKRRVSLPAGESVVRFEGVADGMIAVSAVVSGLPGGVEEKNRDARLLSPASLLDGTLGNRVHIRRTNPATGKVSESDAIIRSGSGGAVVLQTAEGVEALRCSGIPESLVYDSVPEGLSAKPTFSVHTNSPSVTTADVTLTYLATGFDWNASYVAKVAENGKTLDLSAWLTVANGNGADYQGTQLLAVAGKPNQTSDFRALGAKPEAPSLALKCWPMDGTSTYPAWGVQPPPPPAPPMAPAMYEDGADLIVTAMKRSESLQAAPVAVTAQQEDLGDLKLYRVPVPVDVVPNGQKQVALLSKAKVPFQRLYTRTIEPWNAQDEGGLAVTLRMQNKAKEGLGLPLPSGGIVIMQSQDDADMLIGESSLDDKAVGERVELDAGGSDQVRFEQKTLSVDEDVRRIRITLTNALPASASVELRVPRFSNYRLSANPKPVPDGTDSLISVNLPAHGSKRIDLTFSAR